MSTIEPPLNLFATPASDDRIDLSWTDASTTELGFKVERSADGVNFTQVAIPAPNATSYADNGLDPVMTYSYRVRAFDAEGDSPSSNTASATTPAAGTLFVDHFAAATLASAWSIFTGTWDHAGGVLSQTGLGAGDHKAYVSGLTFPADVEVTARVRVDTWAGGDPARAGVSLGGDAAGLGYNLLFHRDTNTVEFLYDHVAWGNRYAFAWQVGTWYRFTLRQEGGVLYGKVWADGQAEPAAWMFRQDGWASRAGAPGLNGGSSAGSTASFDDVSVAIASAPAAIPSAPTGLAATATSAGAIILSWGNVAGETGYVIERSLDGTSGWTQVGTTKAEVTTYSDTGLTGETTYSYRVRAYNGAGESAHSGAVGATTRKRIAINFENLATGTTVNTQYPGIVYSAGQSSVLTVWEQVGLGLTRTGVTSGLPIDGDEDGRHDVYVDFKTPVNGLRFYAVYDDRTGVAARVKVYAASGLLATVPVSVDGANYTKDLVDLRSYKNVTRIEIVNVTDPGGLGWDDFSFAGPSVILAWNGDDNQDDLHTYIVDLENGDVTPRLYDDTFDSALDQLGDDSVSVDWGDSDPSDDGSIPHFFVSGQYTVTIVSEFNGSPVTSTFVLDIGHTPNPAPTADAPPPRDFQVIDWTPIDGAVGYEIYRGLYSDGSDGSLQATVSSPGYNDTTADSETSYYYRIVADFADGTTLDYGIVGAGDAGGGDGTTTAAAGTPRVTRLGTATQADANTAVAGLYAQAKETADKNNSLFVELHDVVVTGRDTVRLTRTIHTVSAKSSNTSLEDVRKWDTNVFLSGGGPNDASIRLRGIAAANRSAVQELGGGKLTATLQDGTVVTSQPDGTWGKLIVQRPGEAQILVRYSGPSIRELNIRHGGTINNIDRIDNMDTFIEEKTATGLLNPFNFTKTGQMINTEVKWSNGQIFTGLDKRLSLLNGLPPYTPANETFKDPKYSGPDQLLTADDLRKIKKVRVEIAGDWPDLRAAVNADMARLQAKYPGYTFTVTFGGTN